MRRSHTRRVTLRPHLLCSALLLSTCGPTTPNDADADASSGELPGGTGAPTPTTAEDPTTGGTTTAEPSTGTEPSTGEPVVCPKDQQAWISVASTALALPAEVTYSAFGANKIGLPDGNLALAVTLGAGDPAPGVVLLSPLGEVLSVHAGAPSPSTFVSSLASDPNGGLLVLGQHGQFEESQAFLARFAADGAALGEVQLGQDVRMSTMVPVGDAALTVGRESGTGWWLRQYAVATGEQQWQSQISAEPAVILTQMVVDAQGDVFVAGAASATDDGFTELRLWRFTGAGQPLWSTSFVVPAYDVVTDLEVAPDGRVLALRIGPFPEFSVDLIAVEPADGALAWEANLAVPDATGRPSASSLHVDADALTIPIVRSEPGKFGRRAVDVQRVSFAGELLELVPLPDIPASDDTFSSFDSVRATCGELTLLLGEGELWFAAYAP